MTKIADTQFTAINLKTALLVSAIAAGDLVPVYDATSQAWKVIEVNDLGSDTEVAAAVLAAAGTSTAAELNKNDISAQAETIIAAGAVSVLLKNSKLALVGAGAVTLAAPDASMYGIVKTIEMTTDNGDVTLALTNVNGGTAGTTCTWSAVGQMLVLVGGTSKWQVVAEAGVALT